MTLDEAYERAAKVVDALRPFCSRIAVAGSVRREKPEPKDIEVVCIPTPRHIREFKEVVDSWPRIKGQATGRYTQRRLPPGTILDLFMATPDNWGLIYAIRTGSADYSKNVLAAGWVRAGYHSTDGMLHKDGRGVTLREEEDLFNLIGVPWVHPRERQ